MITRKSLEEYILSLDGAWSERPFDEETIVYKFGGQEEGEGEMFALMQEGAEPVRISLKSDPQLAKLLRERYETVLPGQNLNKKNWNTVICSGQLSEEEVKDLIMHAYQMARKSAG